MRKVLQGRCVLVCGGRDFNDSALLYDALNYLHLRHRIGVIVHGGARGADALAGRWANMTEKVLTAVYPAQWGAYGAAAGPTRNRQMLDEEHPDLVVAFAGGSGTANMVCQAIAAGIPVLQVTKGAAPVKEIVKRVKEGKKTIRELACGHRQEESHGGRSKLAMEARCKQCKLPVFTAPTGAKTLAEDLPGSF